MIPYNPRLPKRKKKKNVYKALLLMRERFGPLSLEGFKVHTDHGEGEGGGREHRNMP